LSIYLNIIAYALIQTCGTITFEVQTALGTMESWRLPTRLVLVIKAKFSCAGFMY